MTTLDESLVPEIYPQGNGFLEAVLALWHKKVCALLQHGLLQRFSELNSRLKALAVKMTTNGAAAENCEFSPWSKLSAGQTKQRDREDEPKEERT